MGDGTVFIEGHAHAFNDPRQAAYQLGRVDRGDMGCMDPTIEPGDADLLGQLLRAEPAVVGFRQALGIERVQVTAQAVFLLGVTRRAIQGPALAVVTVDAFAGQHLGHFVGDSVQQVKRGAALFRCQAGQ